VNCETRPEKLKFEARGLREGVGYMERWVQRAANLPPHQLIGLEECYKLRQLGVRGEATEKCGFGAFQGLKNQVISTFHSQFCQSCARPLTSRVIVVKFHFTIAGDP